MDRPLQPEARIQSTAVNNMRGVARDRKLPPAVDAGSMTGWLESDAGLIYLQRAFGNQAVTSLLPPPAPPATSPPRSGQAHAVQRQAPATTVPPATLDMGGVTVTTYQELLAGSRALASRLAFEATEVPVGTPQRDRADAILQQEKDLEPSLQAKGPEPLDQMAVTLARPWYDQLTQARKDLENYKKAMARNDMERAAKEADDARAAVDGVPDALADYQRGAFLAKNDELLEKMASVVGLSLQASTALIEIHEKCMEMVGWLTDEVTHVDELVEKFGPFAEIAHKAVAAFEGLHAAITILRGGEGPTEVDEDMSKASAGFGIASAAGSLSGLASGWALYFSALLMVGEACLKVVGVIVREHQHEFNRFYIAQGDLDSVDWSAEPGGREAYDYMVNVMKAGDSTQIPLPVPSAVDKLFVDSEDEFEKGTGEEVPTKGFWFWKHINPDKLKYWLIKNRRSVWSMLYGSIEPPAA